MPKKSKLLAALDAHKGRDYEAEKVKKAVKAAEKRKREKIEAKTLEDDVSDSEEEEEVPVTISNSREIMISEDFEDASGSNVEESDESDEDVNLDVASLGPHSVALPTSPTDPALEEDGESDSSEDEDADQSVNGVVEIPSQLGEHTITTPIEKIALAEEEAEEEDESEDEENEGEDDEEAESDVPLSDLEGEDLVDTIPHQRLTINNGPALIASRNRIALIKNPKKTPFHHHNSLISPLPAVSTVIPDPNDDIQRELEFYRVARDAVGIARSKLKAEKIPFTRPADYFAEMVKSDDHMGKVRKRMYDDASGKKASEEAKKLRDAKKFGKAVQLAKEAERARDKRETLDKIKDLKRKRKGQTSSATNEADDLFQEISVENTPNKDRSGRERGSGSGSGGPPNAKRAKKDTKFGFGGKKRFSKSGDAVSSGDMSGFSARGMKGASSFGSNSRGGGRGGSRGGRGGGRGGGAGLKKNSQRLGKSRRAARS